jgi:hypothetical protein
MKFPPTTPPPPPPPPPSSHIIPSLSSPIPPPPPSHSHSPIPNKVPTSNGPPPPPPPNHKPTSTTIPTTPTAPSAKHNLSYKQIKELEKQGLNPDGTAILSNPSIPLHFNPTIHVPRSGSSRWDYVARVERSENGRVFFPVFRNGTKSVLKGCTTVVQELFGYEMALNMGVCIPGNLRAIVFTNPEFYHLKKALDKCCGDDVVKKMSIERELNRPFFMEMDFITGNTLYRHCNQWITRGRLSGTLFTSHLLYDLGRILALDVLLNNWDRLPLLWENEGNGDNLLFIDQTNLHSTGSEITGGHQQTLNMPNENTLTRIISIDQSITSILPSTTGYDAYLSKVRLLISEICRPPLQLSLHESNETQRKDITPLFGLRLWLYRLCGKDIEIYGEFLLRIGFLSALSQLFTFLESDKEELMKCRLHQLKTSLAPKYHIVDWQDIWKDGLSRISVDFLSDVIGVMRDAIYSVTESCLETNILDRITIISNQFFDSSLSLRDTLYFGHENDSDLVKVFGYITHHINITHHTPHHTPHQHHITSHHITSHHITSHHITSHHITSHHINITSHHINITSHHITSHHITSHHITSHHITSHQHHITSHHINITSHHINITSHQHHITSTSHHINITHIISTSHINISHQHLTSTSHINITHHTSHITHHTSHITHHTSHITHHTHHV